MANSTKLDEFVVGVLLAGGQARRMGGGDKCLKMLGGMTLLDRAIQRAAPQVDTLILNANGDAKRFALSRLPIVADVTSSFAGPLSGILTALEWAAEKVPNFETVASFPTDAPFFPANMVEAMLEARRQTGAMLARAAWKGRSHPVFGIWPVNLRHELRLALEGGERKVKRWTEQYPIVTVEFTSVGLDPFFNANTPGDLVQAERILNGAKV